jgi:aminoglycoside 2'-N-acetyltransferase I
VPRPIKFGEAPWRTIGYVEAVATEPDRQGKGVGTRVMQALHREIASRWPAAMLSTGRARGFYESLGWERWQGPSYTRSGTGIVADDEHGGLMILRLDASLVPDLTVGVTCEDRPGDAW